MKVTTKMVAATTVATCALCLTPMVSAAVETKSFYLGGTRQQGQPSAVSPGEAQAFTNDVNAIPILYPRDLAPLIGTKTLDQSIAQGRAALHSSADSYVGDPSYKVRVVGVSQGAVVAQLAKKDWSTTDPGATNVSFLTYGDPTNTDGGLLAKIPRPIALPGFLTPVAADDETPFDTTTVAIEYDVIADAPDKPNPVSWVNAAMGAAYYHSTYTGDMAEQTTGVVRTETENGKGAINTQILVKTPKLPLVQPLRDLGVDEDLVRVIEKPLKKAVDAGYTGDRGNDTVTDTVTTGNKVKPGETFKDKLKAVRDKKRALRVQDKPEPPKVQQEQNEPDKAA